MPLRLRDAEPSFAIPAPPPPDRPAAAARRRPFRDNSRLILIGILLLGGALAALLTIANRSAAYSPDFLVEVVLYALSVADVTMLAALLFVLARNIIKLIVERRRALPFARFRAKLVAVLLGMTLIPSVLVLIVGSEVIRTSADRWFNAPMDEVLSSANTIAGDYYRDRQKLVTDHAQRIARMLPGELGAAAAPLARARRDRAGSHPRAAPDGRRLPRAARHRRSAPRRARHRRGLADPAAGQLACIGGSAR